MSRIDNTKYAKSLLTQPASNTYDFDLTTISSDGETQPFEALVERHGLTEHEAFEYLPQYSTTERTAFIWYNPENGLVIECNKNPVSDETPGNASYIAICGPKDVVKSLAVDLVLTVDFVKDGGPDAGFMSIDSAVKEHVRERIRETLDEREEQRTAHLTRGEGMMSESVIEIPVDKGDPDETKYGMEQHLLKALKYYRENVFPEEEKPKHGLYKGTVIKTLEARIINQSDHDFEGEGFGFGGEA